MTLPMAAARVGVLLPRLALLVLGILQASCSTEAQVRNFRRTQLLVVLPKSPPPARGPPARLPPAKPPPARPQPRSPPSLKAPAPKPRPPPPSPPAKSPLPPPRQPLPAPRPRSPLPSPPTPRSCVPHTPKTLDVGGPQGWLALNISRVWQPPPIYAGDSLRFSWSVYTEHNVFVLPDASSFQKCSFDSGREIDQDQPIVVTLPSPGTYYYACEERGHCAAGQKVAVSVLPAPAQDCAFPPPLMPPPNRPPSRGPPPPVGKSPPGKAAAPPPPKTVVIGDNSTQFWNFGLTPGWTPPPVRKGDILEFKWSNGAMHHVYQVTAADFDSCTVPGTNSTLLAGGESGTPSGDYFYTVKAQPGTTLYFACNVDFFHCVAGMKVAIPVT